MIDLAAPSPAGTADPTCPAPSPAARPGGGEVGGRPPGAVRSATTGAAVAGTLRSARLWLTPLSPADLDEVHAIFADPATWQHLPSGRHTTPDRTREMIDAAVASRAATGCAPWVLRLQTDAPDGGARGEVVGVGGVTWLPIGCWNLGYRLTPSVWGRGLATEVARAGMVHARRAVPDAPVTARVLATNPASARVLDRVGLSRAWQGSAGASTERTVYADRPLGHPLLTRLIAMG